MIHILIIGPPASGKYTIGKEVSSKIDFNYIHEHNILDIITQFGIEDNYKRNLAYLNLRLYVLKQYFENINKGIVSTMVFDFNNKLHFWFLKNVEKKIIEKKGKLIIIELEANQNIRLKRNTNDDRLFYKPTKQDIEKSTKTIYELDRYTKLNSSKDEFSFLKNTKFIKVKNEGTINQCVLEIYKIVQLWIQEVNVFDKKV